MEDGGYCNVPTARKASGWYGFANAIASLILVALISHPCLPIHRAMNSRVILGFDSNFIEHGKLNPLPTESFNRLFQRG